jgi:hypothetical protein
MPYIYINITSYKNLIDRGIDGYATRDGVGPS